MARHQLLIPAGQPFSWPSCAQPQQTFASACPHPYPSHHHRIQHLQGWSNYEKNDFCETCNITQVSFIVVEPSHSIYHDIILDIFVKTWTFLSWLWSLGGLANGLVLRGFGCRVPRLRSKAPDPFISGAPQHRRSCKGFSVHALLFPCQLTLGCSHAAAP